MPNKITETFNKYMNQIQPMVTNLYRSSLDNEDKEYRRSNASYNELINTLVELKDYEDNFQDFTKIDEENHVIYHGKEFCLDYDITAKPFESAYYKKEVYPMVMRGGFPIPGSKFYEIFNDNTNYWGYVSDTPTEVSFELRAAGQFDINKIYLSTTHGVDVKLYVKESYDSDYVEIGSRSGIEHIWNFWPQKVVVIKFVTTSNIFGIRYVAMGLAKYKNSGNLITKPYNIEDLYRINIDYDADIPSGTSIEFYGDLDGNKFKINTDDQIITGGVEWHEIEDVNYGIFDYHYGDFSLGFGTFSPALQLGQTWTAAETYDLKTLRARINVSTQPGNTTLEIYNVVGDLPDGAPIYTQVENFTGLSTGVQWISFDLDTPVSLVEGNKYAFSILTTGVGVAIGTYVTPNYAGGEFIRKSGGVWINPYTATYDWAFELLSTETSAQIPNVIEDSITARPGYKKWSEVYTIDKVWQEHTFDLASGQVVTEGESEIVLPNNEVFIIPDGAVQRVYVGDHVFASGIEYGVRYDGTKIYISFPQEPDNISDVKVDVVLRVETEVKQLRTYVESNIEKDITINLSTLPNAIQNGYVYIRVVNITDKINNEVFSEVQPVTEDHPTIMLYKGMNLIELEFVNVEGNKVLPREYIGFEDFDGSDFSNPDVDNMNFGDLKYFAWNYELKRILTDNVDETSYYLDGDVFKTDAVDTYLTYATPIDGEVNFQLEIKFKGTRGWVTPALRSYNITNRIK